VDHAEVRAHRGQPPRRRRRRRGRRADQGERGRKRRPVLGDPGRRGELRNRHRVRVPSERAGTDPPLRTGLLADRRLAQGPAVLPRVDRRRTGRAHDHRAPPESPGPTLRPLGAPGEAGGQRGLLLRGTGRGGREGRSAAEGDWAAGIGRLYAEALRRTPGDVRPVLHVRVVVLHASVRCGGAE
jgi:hypothetical protein